MFLRKCFPQPVGMEEHKVPLQQPPIPLPLWGCEVMLAKDEKTSRHGNWLHNRPVCVTGKLRFGCLRRPDQRLTNTVHSFMFGEGCNAPTVAWSTFRERLPRVRPRHAPDFNNGSVWWRCVDYLRLYSAR